MTTYNDDIDIDPEQLIAIEYDHDDERHMLVAFALSYLVVRNRAGRRVLVAEILYDPRRQAPRNSYTCAQYVGILVIPRAIVSIRPYER